MLDPKWDRALGVADVFANVDGQIWSYMLVDDGRALLSVRVFRAGRAVGTACWDGELVIGDGDGVDFPERCVEQLWYALGDHTRAALRECGLI